MKLAQAQLSIFKYHHKRQPYSGEELRAIRARNGVGRPPKTHSLCIGARAGYGGYPAYWYVGTDWPSPNYVEWLYKPRSMRHVG